MSRTERPGSGREPREQGIGPAADPRALTPVLVREAELLARILQRDYLIRSTLASAMSFRSCGSAA